MRCATSVTSDGLATLAVRLRSASIPVARSSARLCASPLTNADLCRVMNALPVPNVLDGSYFIVNVFNPEQPLRYDAHRRRYAVRRGYERHPAIGVTWAGARLVAGSLGARLPTIAEWESAAGADRHLFPWGNQPPSRDLANYAEHVGETTVPGAYPASGSGFFDLAGNVGEWCTRERLAVVLPDRWDPDTVIGTLDEEPVKGGGWNKSERLLRGAETRWKWGRIGTVGIGLRIAFDL